MKKLGIILALFIGIIFLMLLTGKVTGTLQRYKNSTPANEPALKTGASFFFSNLKKPSSGSFIVFSHAYTDSLLEHDMGTPPRENLYVKRLCGMPGDQMEMKDGVLFVNGNNFDRDLVLKTFYITTMANLNSINFNLDSLMEIGNGDFVELFKDSVLINLDDKQFIDFQREIPLRRYKMNEVKGVSRSFEWLPGHPTYNVDDWGPLTVPPDHYFVLGDNRHNALDSRFIGFIPKKNWVGTILWK